MSPRKDYKKLLLEQVEKDKAENLFIDNIEINKYNSDSIKREMLVDFKCYCGEKYIKNVRCIIENTGLYCKICTNKNKKQKSQKTNLVKYKTAHPSQSKEVKNKTKETNLKKYNVGCTLQTVESINKTKKTNVEKFGVPHPMQSNEVKKKHQQTCLEKFNVRYPSQSEEIKNKKIKTNMKNRGVEYPFQSDEIRDKSKATCIEKFGVPYPMQSDEIRDKSKATCIEKFGVPNPMQSDEIRDKFKATCIEKFGVPNPLQSDEIKNKIRETNIKKFGVPHPMQSQKIFELQQKSLFKQKLYKFKSGEEDNCQGYEPLALKELEHCHNYTYEDYKNWNNLEFYYEINNKKHRYYPDIPFIRINKIIEVKSDYTFYKDLYKNLKKAECVIKQGFDLEFWIYDSNFNKFILDNKTIELKQELHKELIQKKKLNYYM